MFKAISCSLLFLIGLSQAAMSQLVKSDGAEVQSIAEKNIETYFNKVIGSQSRLYNGFSYVGYRSNIDGSPYFLEEKLLKNGTVVYNGFKYDNVPLLYDVYKDVLVSNNYESSLQYSLISEKVSSFTILDHHHVFIDTSKDSVNIPFKSGFLELLHDGKTQVLVKRSASLQQTSGTADLRKYFQVRTQFFVKKDGSYSKITNESSFLKLFKDHKAEMKRLLKTNAVKFRKEPTKAMVLLANYFDNLSN